MRTYYKITCTREDEMTGAGLGYAEIFGSEGRYFWDSIEATQTCLRLNAIEDEDLRGTYHVEERGIYEDGSYDDDGSKVAAEQLGLEVLR